MKNILVTGGLGYVGINVCNLILKRKNFNCIILDNLSNSSKDKLKILNKINSKKPTFYLNNINDSTINKIFKRKIYAVIHCAAIKSVNESILKPIEYYNNNISGLINLLSTMKKNNCNKLIFSSSACVYDHKIKPPYKENSALVTENPYGFTKLICEKIISNYSARNKKFNSIILRYFNPIGTDDTGLLVDNPKNPANIIPSISKCIRDKKVFNIYGDKYNTKDGSCYRDYIDIRDIAESHMVSLKNISKFKNEIFNVGTGKPISVKKIVSIFKKDFKYQFKTNITKTRDGDPPISFADAQKIYRKLIFKPKFNIMDSLNNISKYQINDK
jgi:UDP-glucose 4-epimerase